MEDDFVVEQIRQKFGELIVYYRMGIKDEINDLVQQARQRNII